MAEMTFQELAQESFIMATGRAATPDEVQYLLSLEGDGTWQPFFDLIDEYFTYLANQAGGIDKLVQQLAQNAFGLTLTDSQVEDVIPWFFSQGVDTWSKLVLWSIFNTDSLGQTLNQRADAADHLLQVLQQSNKADLFKGFMSTPEAVAQSVKSLIQSVGADAAYTGMTWSGLTPPSPTNPMRCSTACVRGGDLFDCDWALGTRTHAQGSGRRTTRASIRSWCPPTCSSSS